MPDLSSVNWGSFWRTDGSISHSLYLIMLLSSRGHPMVEFASKGLYVLGRAATTGAHNGRARIQQRGDAANHLRRSFVVHDFHIHQLWLTGIGLRHYRQTRGLPIAFNGLTGALHIHASAAIE